MPDRVTIDKDSNNTLRNILFDEPVLCISKDPKLSLGEDDQIRIISNSGAGFRPQKYATQFSREETLHVNKVRNFNRLQENQNSALNLRFKDAQKKLRYDFKESKKSMRKILPPIMKIDPSSLIWPEPSL